MGLALNIMQQRWLTSNWPELETRLQFDRNGSGQCNIFSEGSSKPSEAFQSSIPSSLVYRRLSCNISWVWFVITESDSL